MGKRSRRLLPPGCRDAIRQHVEHHADFSWHSNGLCTVPQSPLRPMDTNGILPDGILHLWYPFFQRRRYPKQNKKTL